MEQSVGGLNKKLNLSNVSEKRSNPAVVLATSIADIAVEAFLASYDPPTRIFSYLCCPDPNDRMLNNL
jgi:hypothetical protein